MTTYSVVGLSADKSELHRYDVGTSKKAAVKEARETLTYKELLEDGLERVVVETDKGKIIKTLKVRS